MSENEKNKIRWKNVAQTVHVFLVATFYYKDILAHMHMQFTPSHMHLKAKFSLLLLGREKLARFMSGGSSNNL